MTVQTSYVSTPAIGRAGQIRNGIATDISTRFAEGTGVAAGLVVVAGTAEHQAKVPASDFSYQFLGVVKYDSLEESQGRAATELVSIVRKGCVLVAYEPDTVPTHDTPAYARHTANGAGKLTLGAVRANTDTNRASVIPGGTFGRVFTTEGLVELWLSGIGTVGPAGPTGPTGPASD